MPTAAPGIGSTLRNARLERSLSIEETAWRTRIRPELLRALEDEDFTSIGHQAFVRSHLASYAKFLGVDPDQIVATYESLQEPTPSSIEELDQRRRRARKPPRAKWFIAAAVCGAILAAAGLVGVLGGQAERPVPVPESPIPSSPPASTPAPVPAAEARVRARIDVLADTQLSVIVDGETIFEGAVAGGVSRVFRARDRLEVLAADGGSISLRVNGEDVGIPGDPGTVYRGVFGPDGSIGG